MGTWIAEKITQKLIASSVIEEGDRELYVYGFFLLTNKILYFLVAAIAGALVGVTVESVVFYIVFMSLRTYAGGIHAKTELQCTILTSIALNMAILGIKYMEQTSCTIIPIGMLISGCLCIALFSPLDTKEKPLEKSEKVHYHSICLFLISVCIALSLILKWLHIDAIYYSIVASVFLEGILLCLGNIGKRNNPAQNVV